MSARLKHFQMARAIKTFEDAQAAALEALDDVVEAEMAQLAIRFPKRRIELHSEMGGTSMTISRRHPSGPLDCFDFDSDTQGSSFVEIAPDLWSAITTIADSVLDGKDPGFGVVIYDNGKRIKGIEKHRSDALEAR